MIKKSICLIMSAVLIMSCVGCTRKTAGPELINVENFSEIEGYWSEDGVGFVLEIENNEVTVRCKEVMLKTKVVKRDDILRLDNRILISPINGGEYGYIKDFVLNQDDTINMSYYESAYNRVLDVVLNRVDYPYGYVREDSILADLVGTYANENGDKFIVKESDKKTGKTTYDKHNCGYKIITSDDCGKNVYEDIFLSKTNEKDTWCFVDSKTFDKGMLVRKNAEGKYDMIQQVFEYGEDDCKVSETVYKKVG